MRPLDPRLSIVLPCYNEGSAIARIVQAFREVLVAYPYELILVDNGSIDDTSAQIARELNEPRTGFLRATRVEVNQGYGYGILAGLKLAQAPVLAWSHADLQTPVRDIFAAFEKLELLPAPQRTLVKGRRQRRTPAQELITLGMQTIATAVLCTWLTDINAQPKVFPRALYEAFREPPHDFSLDLYLYYLARKSGYAIETIPVIFEERPFGESKWNFNLRSRSTFIRNTIQYIFKLRVQGV